MDFGRPEGRLVASQGSSSPHTTTAGELGAACRRSRLRLVRLAVRNKPKAGWLSIAPESNVPYALKLMVMLCSYRVAAKVNGKWRLLDPVYSLIM